MSVQNYEQQHNYDLIRVNRLSTFENY
ncbi:hypothetical protein AERO8C_20482 [Aeromonas veronii]|uniref:Uncharacterized protein n=1 Tax=Aeromonas veronii TaxID=654 RepID=A0A653L3P2_AERVE|nr:hypothetical protein AERO8C_20482 [Aeromonas veronii]